MIIKLSPRLDITEVKAQIKSIMAFKEQRIHELRQMYGECLPSLKQKETAQDIINTEVSDINLLAMMCAGIEE